MRYRSTYYYYYLCCHRHCHRHRHRYYYYYLLSLVVQSKSKRLVYRRTADIRNPKSNFPKLTYLREIIMW